MFVKGWVGILNQKHTRAYRVGGLVKNVTILGVCTFWTISRGECFATGALCISLIISFTISFTISLYRVSFKF